MKMEKFVKLMTGHFDNREQFTEMKSAGKLFPYARHVNTVCNDFKINNIPVKFSGILFILSLQTVFTCRAYGNNFPADFISVNCSLLSKCPVISFTNFSIFIIMPCLYNIFVFKITVVVPLQSSTYMHRFLESLIIPPLVSFY